MHFVRSFGAVLLPYNDVWVVKLGSEVVHTQLVFYEVEIQRNGWMAAFNLWFPTEHHIWTETSPSLNNGHWRIVLKKRPSHIQFWIRLLRSFKFRLHTGSCGLSCVFNNSFLTYIFIAVRFWHKSVIFKISIILLFPMILPWILIVKMV